MTLRASSRLAALAIAVGAFANAPMVLAQTTPSSPQSTQEHDAHHPDGKAPAKPDGMGMMGQPGMMGGQGGMMRSDMMQMMRNMMTMMSAESGMMASHVEGRIAELKSELKITDAQMPQWNRFADTLRATGRSMSDMHQQMMESRSGKALPERLVLREKAFAAHLAVFKTVEEALQPLYASFSDEQKKIADGIAIGPMGLM